MLALCSHVHYIRVMPDRNETFLTDSEIIALEDEAFFCSGPLEDEPEEEGDIAA